MHEARKFRHVVRHNYALQLRLADVGRNVRLGRKLVPAFASDYRRFAARMLANRVRGKRAGRSSKQR
jgi:hypothetical protein